MGPRGEPIIILLCGYNVKLLCKFISLYSHISASIRAHQKSFFVQQRVVNAETRNWSMYKE